MHQTGAFFFLNACASHRYTGTDSNVSFLKIVFFSGCLEFLPRYCQHVNFCLCEIARLTQQHPTTETHSDNLEILKLYDKSFSKKNSMLL